MGNYAFKCKACADWHIVKMPSRYDSALLIREYTIRCPQRKDATVTRTYYCDELKPISGYVYFDETEEDNDSRRGRC